jgi:hypothetical protein
MASATYCAAVMDAETGGNETYTFDAEADLLEMPPPEIIDIFIKHLDREGIYPSPISCQLDFAVKKQDKKVVLATGSLVLTKGEIPFLLMISPRNRTQYS